MTLPLILALSAAMTTAEAPAGADVVADFRAVCLDSGGDRAAVEAAALARGFAPAQRELEERVYADNADPEPVSWARGEGDGEVRVVWAPTRVRQKEGPWTPIDQCVVRGPGDFRPARTAVIDLTGVDPFRGSDGRAAIFLWMGDADGRHSLRQVDYDRRLGVHMRDGAEMIRVHGYRDRDLDRLTLVHTRAQD